MIPDLNEQVERAIEESLAAGDYNLMSHQLGRMTSVVGPNRARKAFSAFRRAIRPNMLWGRFVSDLTFELFEFCKAMMRGERPKLVISCPPQSGKSWAAEDFIAWFSGRHPISKRSMRATPKSLA